ncbi:PLDc N-terminal domain-containing protein [Pontibacter cellulosilyticus]|uniref:PLDc N-terminal domain-containing protein n=1 Tax=Pontibacter cellulosilyticus TaxID=1720253 RepID=A0A923SQ72_9BACT|nr:PLDc N-terminal domain-containing protein [Pontibacter cellulosilyticus]MBC5994870.1 PLDc N-terminal domain-containing protein [Pontibacter cellulosilyticus]
MEQLFAQYPLVVILILANYLVVLLSIFHLIFRSHYTLTQRLNWMVLLWILPVFGPVTYWYFWQKGKKTGN